MKMIADEEEECGQPDNEYGQLLPKPETPVVPADDQVELSIPAGRQLDLPPEEMFNSSFCWFLFFAVSAVLMSDAALMVAESMYHNFFYCCLNITIYSTNIEIFDLSVM